jgi:PAS domain S-box-containing protein
MTKSEHARGAADGESRLSMPASDGSLPLILDHMLNGVAYCRVVYEEGKATDWVYLFTNPAFHRQTGLGPVAGKRASEAIPGIQTLDPQLVEIYGRVATSGVPEKFEYFVNSLRAWCSAQVYCPKPAHFVAVFDVITESKRREDDLRSAQDHLSLALRASHSGIWDWDIPEGTLYWTPEFMELFGLDPATTAPSFDVWRAAVHPDDRVAAEEHISSAVRDRTQLFNEYRIVLPAGHIRWVRAYGNTIYSDDGLPLRMAGICVDATEEKSLASAAANADAASQAKNRFLATMSHELRTPLNAIIGFSALMLAGQPDDRVTVDRKQLEMVNAAGHQLLELVSEVLDISGIESGRLAIATDSVDLAGLVREQCDLMNLEVTEHGLQLCHAGCERPVIVRADAKRVRQVLRNLISNAIKYTDHGQVRVDATREGGVAKISVRDTGIGIPSAEQSKLFVPFGRIHSDSGRIRPGVGLGLAISRRLVESMGGAMGFSSEEGRGSTFWFMLPLP